MTRISRIFAFALVALIAIGVFGPAQAQSYYPYCVQFSDGSGMDCSYPSLQSCLASVSGVGGMCTVNPRSPNQPPPPRLPNPFKQLLEGNGPAFAPIQVGPPPDSGLAPLSATPASGNMNRYCAMYSDGSNNCGFPTMQSCRAAVSGVGGTCSANPRLQRQSPRTSGLSIPADTHWLPPPPPSH